MFDLGFSEIVVIGAVALVVLGPEKLPVVAKTAGNWIGKAQRMVSQVKEDIEREAELSELKSLKEETERLAEDVKKTVQGEVEDLQSEVGAIGKDIESSTKGIAEGFRTGFEGQGASEADEGVDDDGTVAEEDDMDAGGTGEVPAWWETKPESQPDTRSDVALVDTTRRSCRQAPSVEELTEAVERLQGELGATAPALTRRNRRLAPRARSNRVRIYR